MAGFDAASTKKMKFFDLPTLIFCSFLHNLSESERKWSMEKYCGSLTIKESKLQGKLTQLLPALYALRKFAQRARSMHDVT